MIDNTNIDKPIKPKTKYFIFSRKNLNASNIILDSIVMTIIEQKHNQT